MWAAGGRRLDEQVGVWAAGALTRKWVSRSETETASPLWQCRIRMYPATPRAVRMLSPVSRLACPETQT